MNSLILVLISVLSAFFAENKPDVSTKTNFHPVHVSYTNVEYIKDKKQFQILIKIFADDFDRVLKKKYGVYLNLANGEKPKAYEKIIDKYIFEHFKIVIDKENYTKSSLKFIHFELRDKAVWLHYICKYKGKSYNFELWNSLMTDLYEDQTNLLIFSFNGFQKAIMFTNDKTSEVLSIKKD